MTLADVPEEEIKRLTLLGVDLVWLMGVWRVGPKSVEIARSEPSLVREYKRLLPDYTPDDAIGSPYSIAEYVVDPSLGGTKALVAFRNRLAKKGIGLVLDLVPNHTGLDHRWITQKPEVYVQGDEEDLRREPGNYFRVQTVQGPKILAHGRDPYFAGWTDTAQLNFAHPALRSALQNILTTVAEQCDGVRCDMAMLVLNEVFRRTWGDRPLKGLEAPASGEFWTEAIAAVRERHSRFIFLAEVYWGLEGKLHSLGFDFTYDKSLYDHLRHGNAFQVMASLQADLSYQEKSLRFLENHDECRAASCFPWDRHRAALVIMGTAPGATLYHEGQLEGRKAKLPVQLGRRPAEPVDGVVKEFYERFLQVVKEPIFHHGKWRLLRLQRAWEGNLTWENFVACEWAQGQDWRIVVVNFGPTQGQCYVSPDREGLEGKAVELVDLLGEARYLRDGSELLRRGLYLDIPGFALHVFEGVVKA